MGIKTLMVTAALALCFLAAPQAARAQKDGGPKDGEAQAVFFDADNRPTLKFTNKSPKRQRCGAFAIYALTEDREEAIAARVIHLHVGSLGVKPSLPESGWLYITPTRIIFSVEVGDKAHGFDLPRSELKEKAVSDLGNWLTGSMYAGMEFHLKRKLAASESDTQKFVFALGGGEKCSVTNSEPYTDFMKRAVKDFGGTVAEMKRLADSLKQAGRVISTPASADPGN